MTLEFTDAQKHVLSSFGKPYPDEPDVRKWPLKDRNELFFSYELITIFVASHTSSISTYDEVCVVPKLTLAAVSQTFAEHLFQNPNLETFTFDIGRMDKALQQEHKQALDTLNTWLTNLASTTVTDLSAPTFYSEVALRHIARQLRMSVYLADRRDSFIRDAQAHILQPWHITELLYASSIEINARLPIIPEDDTMLEYLAWKMIETTNYLWGYEKKEVHEWLGKKEHEALANAMRRLQEGV